MWKQVDIHQFDKELLMLSGWLADSVCQVFVTGDG